jgi:hypothetical protein
MKWNPTRNITPSREEKQEISLASAPSSERFLQTKPQYYEF